MHHQARNARRGNRLSGFTHKGIELNSQGDKGRQARSPWAMPWPAWKDVLLRTWSETSNDNVGLVAAGVAFYGFLALVPLLGATVLTYGLVADPHAVIADVQGMMSVMPADAAKLIGEQLMNVVQTSDGKKGFGLLLALALALFGARNGAGAVVTALNIAYEEQETRGFVKVNALALGITAGGVLVAIVAMVAVAALGHLESLLPTLPDVVLVAGKVLAYLVMALVGAAGAATLYRYGPARRKAQWVWLTPGSLFAALGWLALTIGFGIYVANFGNYNATYGSLGAVVVLLTWLYLSAYILIFGAELNAELEHQTATDTTVSRDAPIGTRDAWVADHVAEGTEGRKAKVPNVGDTEATSDERSPVRDYAVARAGAQALRVGGLPKVGAGSALLATAGLALLRREGRARAGAALLGTAGAIAFATRKTVPLRAVLFDIDGTLVDSNEQHVSTWDQAFRERGHVIPLDAIRGQIGKGGDLLVPTLVPGVSEDEVEALSARHGAIFKERYLDLVRPFPDAAALLRRVHRSGRKVVLASSAKGTEVEHYLDLLGVRDLVDATTSIDDVETSKPAGDIFAAALKKAGVRANQAVVVGDTPYDIEAAAKCGVRAVAVRSGGFDERALAGAVRRYDDVAALLRGFALSPLG